MPRDIPWSRSIGTRLTLITLVFAVLAAALIAANFWVVSGIRIEAARSTLLVEGRAHSLSLLVEGHRLHGATPESRRGIETKIREHLASMKQRFVDLREGTERISTPDASAAADIRQREERWNTQVVPVVDRLLAAMTPEAILPLVVELYPQIEENVANVEAALHAADRATEERIAAFRQGQWIFGIVTLLISIAVFLIGRGIARRLRELDVATAKIAGGELAEAASVSGTDEVAALGSSINAMSRSLRDGIDTERAARVKVDAALDSLGGLVGKLGSSSSELVAATAEQAAGAQEQTAAVTQVASTIDEISATSDESAQRTSVVAESVRRTEQATAAGRTAIEEGVAAVEAIRGQLDALAKGILTLAEKGQAIGEITASINDIAEQSHILALNAAIEASRAGEHGRGFAVVASEVKALADQSKRATAQVRQILGEVQKSTNAAVMLSEESMKGMGVTAKQVATAGETIRVLADQVSDAARTALQAVASAGQQATGIAQIRTAMRAIQQATHQNTASSRETEEAARSIATMGREIQQILSGYGR